MSAVASTCLPLTGEWAGLSAAPRDGYQLFLSTSSASCTPLPLCGLLGAPSPTGLVFAAFFSSLTRPARISSDSCSVVLPHWSSAAKACWNACLSLSYCPSASWHWPRWSCNSCSRSAGKAPLKWVGKIRFRF